ncbi:TetR/AcrR family transcriptional regulator [Streptomyces thermolilacinus]|uniref:TetR family transcriptional regulator n=1 Tax=Streptomyces thermolilacinus SPC6 TaxID=1306406 RepID=A0A1D3DYK7_9ACTN|nr:TetR/AcrR family transcriptional regulator [Streptomyces thermolilacinus]OEJ97412.1 TetR family transcriptional regulator [Streptomyces thermolilacinus SPC6]
MGTTQSRIDGRIARGNQTRQLILGRAVDIASVEGLEGLSLGRLAGELKLSKSGVFALFGSKEDLQLATIRAAIKIYLDHVVHPAQALPPGIGRLWQLCSGWLTYSRERVFPGGCFFYSAVAEYDAREGKVHDALAAARTDWFGYLEQTVRDAQAAGEIEPDTDVAQLVFEIVALLEMANAESVLYDEYTSYDRAATAIRNRLRDAATDPALLPAA